MVKKKGWGFQGLLSVWSLRGCELKELAGQGLDSG